MSELKLITYNELERLALKFIMQKSVFTTAEAKVILGVGNSKWEDVKDNLTPSKIFGKWSAKSVYQEFERIHGFKHRDVSL